MSLGDHLREIRYRITVSVLALVLAAVGCAFFYQPLVLFIMEPYNVARTDVKAANPEANLQLALAAFEFSGLVIDDLRLHHLGFGALVLVLGVGGLDLLLELPDGAPDSLTESCQA